jgi:hypothetical protein
VRSCREAFECEGHAPSCCRPALLEKRGLRPCEIMLHFTLILNAPAGAAEIYPSVQAKGRKSPGSQQRAAARSVRLIRYGRERELLIASHLAYAHTLLTFSIFSSSLPCVQSGWRNLSNDLFRDAACTPPVPRAERHPRLAPGTPATSRRHALQPHVFL